MTFDYFNVYLKMKFKYFKNIVDHKINLRSNNILDLVFNEIISKDYFIFEIVI